MMMSNDHGRYEPRSKTFTEAKEKEGFMLNSNSRFNSCDKCLVTGNIATTSSSTTGPTSWKTLDTQVGGHYFSHGSYRDQRLGIIDLEDGFILKSLQNPPRGLRELGFYTKVFAHDCYDKDIIQLRKFLSPFAGTEERNGAFFIKLKNLTGGFQQPCVADLKMGRVTYDQDATDVKKAREIAKFPPLSNLGFQFTGMTIYDPKTQSRKKLGRDHCRRLKEDTMTTDGLGHFFGLHNSNLRRDVIQVLIEKLKKMESWFLTQKRFTFIASSLLMVYEGDVQRSGQKDKVSPSNNDDNDTADSTRTFLEKLSQDVDVDSMSELKKFKQEEGKTTTALLLNDEHIEISSDGVMPHLTTDVHGLIKMSSDRVMPPLTAHVHLIDFAHVFPTTDIDQNFLFGLQKLIASLQELLICSIKL